MIQSTPNPAYLHYSPSSQGVISDQQQAALKQKTDENPAVQAAQDTQQDPKVLLGALGYWVLLRAIMKPVNKAMSGEYKDTFLGKVGSFGDKVSQTLHLDKISTGSSKFGTWAANNRFLKYFTKDYKTASKNSLAAAMEKGTMGELAQDSTQVLEAYVKSKGTQANLTRMAESLKEAVPESAEDIIAFCKKHKVDLCKEFSLDDLTKFMKNPIDNVDDIIKSLKKADPNEFVKFGKPLVGRKVYLSELANKLSAITGEGSATGLGKALSKGTLRTLEGLTNGTAGGPLAIFMQAFSFAQATKAAINAPKGEKVSTFMENVTNDLGYYLVGASALNVFHRVAGNKYRGMTKETIKDYKEWIKFTNTEAAAGRITKAELKDAKQIAKEMLTKNLDLKWWEKPIKAMGKVLSVGLDSFDPIIKATDGRIIKYGKKALSMFKGAPGGIMRLVLIMGVITPALVKPMVKACHLIFGKPTKSVLDKDTDSDKDKKIDTNPAGSKTAPNGSTNYLDILSNKNQPATPAAQQPASTQANPPATVQPAAPQAATAVADNDIASKKLKDENKQTEVATDESGASAKDRSYIPSSTPTQFPEQQNQDDNDAVNNLMKKADDAEKSAMQCL